MGEKIFFPYGILCSGHSINWYIVKRYAQKEDKWVCLWNNTVLKDQWQKTLPAEMVPVCAPGGTVTPGQPGYCSSKTARWSQEGAAKKVTGVHLAIYFFWIFLYFFIHDPRCIYSREKKKVTHMKKKLKMYFFENRIQVAK